MLDQNTDRMWYVIGAVLIGGIIIAAAVTLFQKGVFSNIESSLEGLMKKATEAGKSAESASIMGLTSMFKGMPLF